MKQKDWLIIGAVGFIAAIFSVILSGVIFGSPQKNPIKVPVVTKISSDFPSPQTDDTYKSFFNDKALNPTQLIHIGDDSNKAPFRGGNGQ
jgi:hypothetical protein